MAVPAMIHPPRSHRACSLCERGRRSPIPGPRLQEMKTETVTSIEWDSYLSRASNADTIRRNGRVNEVIGMVIESQGPAGSVGEMCRIYARHGSPPLPAQIVGFRDRKVLLMPLGNMEGVHPGSEVVSSGRPPSVGVTDQLLGRVINGLGEPMDGLAPIHPESRRSVTASSPDPIHRRRISEPIGTGIRAIDGLITMGKGQRMGIFSGSGVGKSILLGMVARYTSADVNVIALIGERGREVREFIERDLGEEGLKRSVVVVATSDEPPLVRIQAAMIAITTAEFFRDKGKDVFLMMDSITRFATAQREVGLAIGEPPATRGYTPSVFALLPRFLERAGTTESNGSITGLYTVLVEADDMNEPIGDTARSILDGHIVLSRALATQGHYPSIDVLESISRVMTDITDEAHQEAAIKVRDLLSAYRDASDLIDIGAYQKGSNPRIDEAIRLRQGIHRYLRQAMSELTDYESNVRNLYDLASEIQVTEPVGRK